MRLDRIEIAGFFHFAAPAVLDLRALPAGLIALVGPNGHGKTRFLDAGPGSIYGPGAPNSPNLAFPSREHTLAEYATERTAYIESLWDVDGAPYRVRVNVDGVRRTTDAVVEEMVGDRRVPMNDGKTSTFKEAIARVFPSRRQLLSSAFAAQGRQGSFVALDQKGRMELFAELCDLGHYASKAAAAGRCVSAADQARTSLLAAREILTREIGTGETEALAARRDEIDQALEESAAYRAELQDAIDDLGKTRSESMAAAQEYLTAQDRVTAALRTAERIAADRRTIARDIAAAQTGRTTEERTATDRHAASLRDLATALAQADDTCRRAIADAAVRITNNQAVIDDAENIRSAADAKRSAENRIGQLRDEETAGRRALELCLTDLADAEKALATIAGFRAELVREREQVEALAAVPCRGVGEYAACRFLTRAAAAQDKIPSLMASVAEEPEQVVVRTAALERATIARADLAERSRLVAECAARIAANTKAALEPALKEAEARIAGYEQSIRTARETLTDRTADLAERRNVADLTLATGLKTAETRAAQTIADLTVRDAALLADQTAAEADEGSWRRVVERTQDAASRLHATEAALASARTAYTANEAAVARQEAALGEVARLTAEHARRTALLTDVDARLTEAGTELVSWRLLAKAYGRDGLPRLEVDAAGPTVSNLCNDLLLSCYGARFAVEVVTQVKRADGKAMREEFSVVVVDNEYGGEARDIADLSGGERVIVEEALRSAIALFVNSRNQRPIRTFFRDETTGALDPENVPRYMAMLRRIQQIGGVHQILFVSHSAEAAALADAQIHVLNGQPTIALPPYRSAA